MATCSPLLHCGGNLTSQVQPRPPASQSCHRWVFSVQVGGLAGRAEAGCLLAGCGERLLLLMGDTMLCLEGQFSLNTIFYQKTSI